MSNIPHLYNYKYKNVKNSNRFRIVKISEKQFRIDYLLFPLLKYWDKNLRPHWIAGCAEDGDELVYRNLIFKNIEDAKAYIYKGCRNLITFKKPIQEIIKI